jgi:nucleoside-diphosphate-sugar epimerase
MSESVLTTGGAGFIGLHLADELLEAGYEVRVLDNLSRQGDQPYYVSDTRHFSEATGWMPQVSVEQGVSQLRSWIVESMHLGTGLLQPRE